VAGQVILVADRTLRRFIRHGPSTKCLVVRKRAGDPSDEPPS
jgi:hypothetical protein